MTKVEKSEVHSILEALGFNGFTSTRSEVYNNGSEFDVDATLGVDRRLDYRVGFPNSDQTLDGTLYRGDRETFDAYKKLSKYIDHERGNILQ